MDEVVFEDAELVWPIRYLRSGRPASEFIPPRPANPGPGMRPAAAMNAAALGSFARLAVESRPLRRLAVVEHEAFGSFLLRAAMSLLGSMSKLDIVFGSWPCKLASNAAIFGSVNVVERLCRLELLELRAFDLLLC